MVSLLGKVILISFPIVQGNHPNRKPESLSIFGRTTSDFYEYTNTGIVTPLMA